MSSLTVEIKGLDRVLKKIGDLEKLDVIKDSLHLAGKRIEKRMKKYPPARPSSSYVRTKALGKHWTTQTKDKGFTVIVGNNIKYGPFVQSEEQQAWMHKDYWHTDKQVVDEEKDEIFDLINKEIQKVLNR